MGEITVLERVIAVLCLGHITLNVLTAIESMRMAALLGRKWETTVNFTTITAFILSVTVMARWIYS